MATDDAQDLDDIFKPRPPREQELRHYSADEFEGKIISGGGMPTSVTLPRPMRDTQLVDVYVNPDADKEDVIEALLRVVAMVQKDWYRAIIPEIQERERETPAFRALAKWLEDVLDILENPKPGDEIPPLPWEADQPDEDE